MRAREGRRLIVETFLRLVASIGSSVCACPNPRLNYIVTCWSRFKHVIVVLSCLYVVLYTHCRIYRAIVFIYMMLHVYTCCCIHIHAVAFIYIMLH